MTVSEGKCVEVLLGSVAWPRLIMQLYNFRVVDGAVALLVVIEGLGGVLEGLAHKVREHMMLCIRWACN